MRGEAVSFGEATDATAYACHAQARGRLPKALSEDMLQ